MAQFANLLLQIFDKLCWNNRSWIRAVLKRVGYGIAEKTKIKHEETRLSLCRLCLGALLLIFTVRST
jgi:hypothetical protein